MKKEVLRLQDVTYKKENTIIFRNMTFSVMEGEIMGITPLNSYGMDELLDVIVNNLPLYYGYVYYQERCVNSWKEEKHIRNRICLIDSETSLVNGLNVITNIFTLRAGFGKEILNETMLARQLAPFLEEIHISIDPFLPVEKLSAYNRVIVELLRAVVAGYHLIIFREISTVISEAELEKLFEIMRYYTGKGFTFLYVSYHFEEVQQGCSRAILMSEGSINLILDQQQIQKGISKNLYIDFYNHVRQRMRHRARGLDNCSDGRRKEVLYVKDITRKQLRHFQFSVYEGECLVIQSLDTKMYRELRGILEEENGLRDAEMFVDGRRICDYRSRSMAFLKEESSHSMLFEDLTVCDNLCLGLDGKIPSVWMKKKIQKSVREEYYRLFGEDIFDCYVNELTDEQKTRVVYMRILLQKPRVVFMVQPFKHGGTPHRLQVWELQTMLLAKGISIVILAMNMSDSLTIADRVIRISRTEDQIITKEFGYKQFSELPTSLPWVGFFDEIESKKEKIEWM
ncbi:hypothetical protein [Blautia sp.]|uniref:Galactose/methyl galactoside import ATP-binding protein MglA n=1 Tax=Blautia glucerasea TaxID=536633 RepID=A0A6N2U720_9FIRM